MTVDERSEGIVALSRWRAILARSRNPRKRLDALLAEPQAAAVVPRVPALELYYLVRTVGLADAVDVLRLASPEQLQGCLDLDLWRGDRVSTPRLLAWLEVLTELPSRTLAATMRTLDAELAALVIGRHARIYDPSVREAPADDSPFVIYRTPDSAFVVEFRTAEATVARTLERFVDRLYRTDPDLARSLLTEAKWGITTELEEESYRWRTARLADAGFPAYDEALALYRYQAPRRSPGGAPPAASSVPPTLPVPVAEALGEDSLLGRVLAGIEDAGRMAALSSTLVALVNRALVADRVDPADVDGVRETAARARDTLSLGLELLAGDDPGRAAAVLESTPLADVFCAGFSRTADLGRRARALDRAGVIDPALDPLAEARPLFPCALDPEPTAGARPFRSVADLGAADAFLGELESTQPPD